MLNIKTSCALTLAAALTAACSSDDDPVSAEQTKTVAWSACESGTALECSELDVPLDYGDTEGEKITLSLIRKPATGTERKGALLFNPGGPGGSGIELIEAFEEGGTIPAAISAAYDIVSFDPRGVGKSGPVNCGTQDDINDYPLDAEAIRDMHAGLTAYNNACFAKYGSYLQQLGSINVVRDMEEIRLGMGEDKLNFIGYSYGSRLAALYLQQYPTHSGRLVLDGSLDPDSSIAKLSLEAAPALHANLLMALSRCRLTDDTCDADQLLSRLTTRVNALTADTSDAAEEELEILSELVSNAATDPEFSEITAEPLINYATSYDRSILEQFIVTLQQLGMIDEDDDSNEDNETTQTAVMCADDANRPAVDELITLHSELNQVSDIAAEVQLAQAGMCAGWPAALEPVQPIATSVAPVALVIGGTTDAQTPLLWSESMAQAIGGVFIRSEHPGHVAVFVDKSACLDDLVEKFLLDGLTPAATQCLAD